MKKFVSLFLIFFSGTSAFASVNLPQPNQKLACTADKIPVGDYTSGIMNITSNGKGYSTDYIQGIVMKVTTSTDAKISMTGKKGIGLFSNAATASITLNDDGSGSADIEETQEASSYVLSNCKIINN